MDPMTINRLGRIQQQEILEWAADNYPQPERARGSVGAWFARIWQRTTSAAQPLNRVEKESSARYYGV